MSCTSVCVSCLVCTLGPKYWSKFAQWRHALFRSYCFRRILGLAISILLPRPAPKGSSYPLYSTMSWQPFRWFRCCITVTRTVRSNFMSTYCASRMILCLKLTCQWQT